MDSITTRSLILRLALVACWVGLRHVDAGRAIRPQSSSPYLYAGDSFPVVEYIVSPASSEGSRSKELNEPTFLNEIDQGYRIVQFYSSRFDPVSSQIRESYIQMAFAITEIAKRQQSNITIDAYAICCVTVPVICKKHGTDGNVPSFAVYTPGSGKGKFVNTVSTNSVLNTMGIPLKNDSGEKSTYSNIQIDVQVLSSSDNNRHMRTVDDLKSDIYLSFHTVLRNRTFLDFDEHGKVLPLSLGKRAALKNFLLLIQKTVPPSWSIHVVVKQLVNSFMYICKNKAYLFAILDEHQPTDMEYSSACQTGPSHVSRFTCGAWELIHAISVGVVERNTMILHHAESLSETKSTFLSSDAILLEETASVISDFVHHFGLGDDETEGPLVVQHLERCKEENCLQINRISAMVSEWIKLPLFLSKMHSDISFQKQHDRAIKDGIAIPSLQQHISAMWPPKQYCPKCWNDQGTWNNDVVYKFMQLEYTDLNEWSLSTPAIRHELLGTQAVPVTEGRQLLSNENDSRNRRKNRTSSYLHNEIFFSIQKFFLLCSGLGVFLYRVVSNQNKKHQQAVLILPQTIRTQISRKKSLTKSTFASFIMDQKQS